MTNLNNIMPENTPPPKSSGPPSSGKSMNVWMIVSAVLAIALIIAIVSASKGDSSDPDFKPVSSEEAGSTLLDFVNEVYAGQIGQSILKSVTEKNGMYEVIVTVNSSGQNIDQTVFMSKDAKLFIPQALDMADVRSQYQTFLNSGQVPLDNTIGGVPQPTSAPMAEDGDEPPIDTPEAE